MGVIGNYYLFLNLVSGVGPVLLIFISSEGNIFLSIDFWSGVSLYSLV